jgi:hypothetical protein
MKDVPSSPDLGRVPDLRSLIEAAKSDTPTTAARAKIWSTLSSTVGAAGAGAGAAASSGLPLAKALVAGTLLGGSITVGLAVSILALGPLPRTEGHLARDFATNPGATAVESFEPAVVRTAAIGLAVRSDGFVPSLAASSSAASPQPPGDPRERRAHLVEEAAPASAVHRHAAKTPPAAPDAAMATDGDDLAREASLLAQARAALARGDAPAALHTVHATLGIGARQLVPEELAIEAQALRALGRTEDAAAVEARLRARFPESGLAR